MSGQPIASAAPGAASAVQTRTARLARVATVVVFGAQALLFASWTAHIPLVKARLSLSDAQLGLALFGAPIGSVVAMLATGWLLARLGSARMVQATLVGYCAVGWMVGEIGSPLELFAVLGLWGVFQGALDVSMNAQGITVERALGRPIMSGFHGAWSLGSFAGAGLGAAAVATGIPLTGQLAVLGTLAAGAAGTASRWLLPDPPHLDEDGPRPSTARVWRHPVVLVLGAVALACMLCEGAAADWSAVYLHDSMLASPAVAGLGYAAFSAATVMLRLTGDRLLARVSVRILVPALAALATVGMLAALLIGTTEAALVGFAALGVGVALIIPAAFSAAGRLPGVHHGAAVAAVSALGWVGFVGGPPLIGHLSGAVTLPVALGLLPLLTLAIAVATRTSRAFAAPPTSTPSAPADRERA